MSQPSPPLTNARDAAAANANGGASSYDAARGTASAPVVERDVSLPLVHGSLAVAAGALLDPPGKEGTTRLLLRLMRRTGAGRSADQADDWIDRIGGHLGAEVGRSNAAFHGGAIARSKKAFFDFLADTVAAPAFHEAEFRQLVEETRAELIEKLDDDRALARSFWNRAVFAGHPYARPASGTVASLGRITLDDLRAQYARLFVRGALRFAYSGQIEPDFAREVSEAIAARLPEGEIGSVDPVDPVGPTGRRLVFVDKPERSQTQILIGGLGTRPLDEDHTALHVANTVFGGTFTARLSQEVRAKRGWSYGAYSSLPIDRRRQSFSMWTFPAATDAAACIRLELELLERWVQDGVSRAELGRAKKYLSKSHVFSVDTASKRAGQALDEILYELPPGYHQGYLERVQAVTLDEVNAAVRARISTENLVVTVVGTHAEIGADVRAVIRNLAEEAVVPFDSEE